MKTIRLLLHSFVLAIIDIAAVLLGFGVYSLLRPIHQIAVQAPAAAIIAAATFLIWNLLIRNWRGSKMALQGTAEFVGTWPLTLLWSPILFVPLHYLGRGYLTSWANIWNLWLFQMPTNTFALWVVWKVIRIKKD
jgi:hypothetical protein